MKTEKLKLEQFVYHNELYSGKEQMKIVGLRKDQVELEGDFSGGTHNVCQRSWMPIKGIRLRHNGKRKIYKRLNHA